MNYQYRNFPTPQVVAQQFAMIFAEWAVHQLQEKEHLSIAISGGNTPQLWFAELAGNYTEKIDWAKLHFFWVDERYVLHDHPESNYGIACKLLFNKIDIPQTNLHPIPVTGDIEMDIESYSKDIENHVPVKNGWPIFDLITLGMGTDGHTASIFPGQLELFKSNVPVCASENPHSGQQRITLTGPVINEAELIYFLVTGIEKIQLLNNIFNEKPGWKIYPASHVRKENTIWLTDINLDAF